MNSRCSYYPGLILSFFCANPSSPLLFHINIKCLQHSYEVSYTSISLTQNLSHGFNIFLYFIIILAINSARLCIFNSCSVVIGIRPLGNSFSSNISFSICLLKYLIISYKLIERSRRIIINHTPCIQSSWSTLHNLICFSLPDNAVQPY